MHDINKLNECEEDFDEEYIIDTITTLFDSIKTNKKHFNFGYYYIGDNIMTFLVEKSEWTKYIDILLDYCLEFERYEYCAKFNLLKKLIYIYKK